MRRYFGWVGLEGCYAYHYFPRDSERSACGLVTTKKPLAETPKHSTYCRHCAKRAPGRRP